jgi:hypothetical protein
MALPFGARVNSKSCRSGLLAITAGLLLAACGGGNDPPANTTEYAVNAAQRHLLVDGGSWTMNGVAPNGVPFTVTLRLAPAAAGSFPVNGTTAARSVETFTIDASGQSDSVAQTIYFDPANLDFVGAESGGVCTIATTITALPASAAAGASGAFFAGSDLDGCSSSSNVVGSTAMAWSLEDNAGAVMLCWNSAFKSATPVLDSTQVNCVEIDADGKLGTKARFALSALGVTITARNF